jgi:hypothetical protein
MPFPPPWVTIPHQDNDEGSEQHEEEQLEKETRNTVADEHDPKLQRLEQEMAKLKVERERLQRLQNLETKEEDLKKIIGEGEGPMGCRACDC